VWTCLLFARVRRVLPAPALGLVAAGLASAGAVLVATAAWRFEPRPRFAHLSSRNNCAQDRVTNGSVGQAPMVHPTESAALTKPMTRSPRCWLAPIRSTVCPLRPGEEGSCDE
jgi:hypothetical protein